MSGRDISPRPLAMPANALPAPRHPKMTTIRPQDLGLKVCYDPQDVDEILVDVVAVHGIGVDPTKTWTHPETRKNWLSDETMLPNDLPKARIMTFGYDSVWYGDNAVKQSLEGVATKLLYELVEQREGCLYRPIIFIGHCFGGLVIQKAYTMALMQSQDWPCLFESVIGVVFLGTPHHDIAESSQLSTQGQIYQAIVTANLQIENNVLSTMAHDSDLLRNAVDAFTRKIATVEPKPTLFCFYEEKPTRVGLIIGQNTAPEFVVNQTSGTLNGHQNQGLSLDHFGMNKFGNRQDYHYRSVKRQITKMLNSAQERTDADAIKSVKPERYRSVPRLGAPIATEANFAPRDGIIEKLESLFRRKQLLTLYGAPGNGKTHVAVEYAHTYATKNPGSNVYWVNANSMEELEASYIRIAERLNLTVGQGRGESIVQEVRQRLERETFLLVLDGFNNETNISIIDLSSDKPLLNIIPYTDRASFLVTTRSKAIATRLVGEKAKYSLEMGAVSLDDASYILLGRVSKDEGRRQVVEKISKTLGGSAGSFAMAASYINNSGRETGRRVYLDKLDERSTGVSGALRAWELLHGLIKQTHGDTVDTLLIMSCLDVQCIPSGLFPRKVVLEYLPILEQHGIVEPSTDRQLFTVTAVFREQAQQWLVSDPQQREYIEDRTLDAVHKRFSDNPSQIWLPCVLAALRLKHVSLRGKRAQTDLLFRLAQHEMGRKNHQGALQRLRKVLERQEADVDLPDRATLMEKTRRAIKEAEASSLQLSGHATWSRTGLDTTTPDMRPEDYQSVRTARNYCEQGLGQVARGNCNEAEKLYRAALEILQSPTSSRSPDRTLMRLHLKMLSCLASMYCSQGRFKEAADIFGIVLPEQKDILGENDPDTLLTRNDHALLLQETDLNLAARELRKVHQEQVQSFGPNDSASLRTETNLALNHRLRGEVNEARKLYQDVLRRQRQTLKENHPDTKRTQLMLEELQGMTGSRVRVV